MNIDSTSLARLTSGGLKPGAGGGQGCGGVTSWRRRSMRLRARGSSQSTERSSPRWYRFTSCSKRLQGHTMLLDPMYPSGGLWGGQGGVPTRGAHRTLCTPLATRGQGLIPARITQCCWTSAALWQGQGAGKGGQLLLGAGLGPCVLKGDSSQVYIMLMGPCGLW